MQRLLASLCLLVGVLLLVAAVFDYQRELGLQQAEQQRRDAQWQQVQQEAARHFPHVLPGGKPDPAPLEGLPLVAGLAITGSTAVVGGAALLLITRRPTGLQ